MFCAGSNTHVVHDAMTKSRAPVPDYPVTVEAAVRRLVDLVPADEQNGIAVMAETDLVGLHSSLGQWIRNYFGL